MTINLKNFNIESITDVNNAVNKCTTEGDKSVLIGHNEVPENISAVNKCTTEENSEGLSLGIREQGAGDNRNLSDIENNTLNPVPYSLNNSSKDTNMPMSISKSQKALMMEKNFEALYDTAARLCNEQAALAAKEGVSLQELELGKAKTENFLASISNFREVHHEMDLIAADNLKFKHKDELVMLNSLKDSCDTHAELGALEIADIKRRIKKIYDDANKGGYDVDTLLIAELTAQLDDNIKRVGGIIANADKLIKLERMAGGRRLR